MGGRTLKFASDYLKNDTDIVTAAVKLHWWALDYASDYLKNNKKDIVLAAKSSIVTELETGLMDSSDLDADMWDDKDIVLALVKKRGSALKNASDYLKNDTDIFAAA